MTTVEQCAVIYRHKRTIKRIEQTYNLVIGLLGVYTGIMLFEAVQQYFYLLGDIQVFAY